MSKADEHAQDLAEFLYFDISGTQFPTAENVQDVLESVANRNDGDHTGTTQMDKVVISDDLYVVNRILVANGGTLAINGDSQFLGTNLFQGNSSFTGTSLTIDVDTDFTSSTVDFTNSTLVGLPTTSASLSPWVQAYRYTGQPTFAPRAVNISRSALEGKEILVVVYDPNEVDEMGVIYNYFPVIGNNMPSDHIVKLGTIHEDGGINRVTYRNGQIEAWGMKTLLVLTRDPVVFPVGGITFDSNVAITWSNT